MQDFIFGIKPLAQILTIGKRRVPLPRSSKRKKPISVIVLNGITNGSLSANDGRAAQQFVGRPDAVAEEVDAVTDWGDSPTGERHAHPVCGELHDVSLNLAQRHRIVAEYHHVVHVPRERHLEFVVQVLVEDVPVDVGRQLTGERADGHALPGVGDDLGEEVERSGIGDLAPHLGMQDCPVDAGEIFSEVGLEEVRVSAPPKLRLHGDDTGVRSFARSTGVGVGQECGVEDRVDYRAERMVHDPVGEGWRADDAGLWLKDGEHAQWARLPSAVEELLADAEETGMCVLVEHEVPVRLAFACGGPAVGVEERLLGGDLVEQVLVLLAHESPSGRWPGLSLALLAPMPDPAMYFPKEVNAADHL